MKDNLILNNNLRRLNVAKINPYLNFPGTTEEAFNFYKSVFGGEFSAVQRWKELPEGAKLPANEKDKIMHIALPIGKDTILMATDALESMGQKLTAGNNFYIAIQSDSKEEAQKLFNGLSAGGNIEMPLQDTFWGDYFGMFNDKFEIKWMVGYSYKK